MLLAASAQAGRTINSATVNGGSSATVAPGASITVTLNVTTDGNGSNNDWESTDWLIGTSSSGSYTCNNHADNTFTGTHTESFTITAPSTPGTYNAYFWASHNDSCGGSGSNLFTLTNAITVSTGTTCSAETVADNFDSVSFSQNDGSRNWSGDWQEIGESDGASAGFVRVRNDSCSSGNCLRLGVISSEPAQSFSNVGASREVDLSGATTATLTFNYRTGVIQNSETVSLQVSANGGSSWTTLRTYTVSSTNSSATAESVDLSSYIASNTQIRFLASGSNAIVGFYADDIEISYDPCSTLLAEWRLDETSWNGTSDEVVDSEGSNHGVANSADTASGLLCNAADLSAAGTSDYISLGSGALNGATDFTISAWIKTSNSGSQALISGANSSQANELIMWFPSATSFEPWLKGVDPSSISIGNIADNQWHHLVWTRSGSQNCIYRDASLQGCTSGSTSALNIDSGGLILGQEQDSVGGGFDLGQDWRGLVDELLIFNEAVSASQITSIYNNTLAGDNWDGTERDCPSGSCSVTYSDDFSAASFTNSSGSVNWSGGWTEHDTASTGAAAGYVSISGGKLHLQNYTPSESSSRPGVARGFSLADASEAVVSYSYSLTDAVDSDDSVLVEISDDGGSSWTTIDTITGLGGGSHSNSISLSSFSSISFTNNMQISIRISGNINSGSCCYGGSNEIISFEFVTITTQEPCSASDVDHYAISHSGQGVTCEAESITITAHDSSEGTVEPGNSVSLTLNTGTGIGDWSLITGNGSLANGTAGDGIASYSWGSGESAVVLALAHPAVTTAPHMDIDLVDNNSATDKDGDGTEDPKLAFSDAGFRFYGAGVANNIGNQIAGKESNLAPGNQTIEIRAVQTNTDTGACEARLTNTQIVQMAYQCRNPATCQGDNKLTLNDSTTLRANPATGVTNYSNVSLNFGSNGQASFTFDYSDAGLIQLHASKTLAASGEDPQVTLSGSSNEFVVRPFGFHIDVPGNPAAISAAGDPFKAAGEAFAATVTAVLWASGDDSDSDGVPDSGADLSDNGVTANFGQESTAETVTLTQGLVLPTNGTNPALSNGTFSGFSAGASTKSNLSWSEVGIISLTANVTDGSYLGAGAVTGTLPYVGRFYPSHFRLSAATLTNRTDLASCSSSSFTYMGEPFGVQYSLSAENSSGVITRNYAGNFAKLDTSGELNLGAVDGTTDLSSRLTLDSASIVWPALDHTGAGTAAIDLNLRIDRDSLPDGPFAALSVGTAPNDEDAQLNSFDLDVSGDTFFDHGLLGSTRIRYGRLLVGNTFGPETEDLEVPLQLEYFDGINFILNTDDSCTTYINTSTSLDHSNYGSDNLEAGDTSVTSPNTETEVVAGQSPSSAPLVLSAPGVGNEGQVDLIYAAPSWLEFDWFGGGDTDPRGQATFGRYRGNDRMIFWQENFSQ
ncbi:LamG domain-containing protein [Motiliproteus coralliicola]|nr:LamG domain-containing protein [Motiliproteus coralliicola]